MLDIHEKITNSIDIMISDSILNIQYYGEFCQFINFRKYYGIDTCGVYVDIKGMNFLFNDDFVDELNQEEMNFVMLHEIFHLLWDHQSRTRRGGYHKEYANMAQDMIINDIIKTDIIESLQIENKKKKRNAVFAELPKDRETNKIWVLHKPEEYKGDLVFEDLYEWLMLEKDKYDNWKELFKSDKSLKCPVSDYLKELFEQVEMGLMDFLDSHIPDDVPEEYKKSLIEDIKNNLKSRGFLTGDIKKTLDKITKSKKDYIKGIKLGINELFGDYKNKSITKRNRRSIPGVKGKRKESYALNVLLDVSGSMSGYFEKSLSYIFQNGIKINLIQCDVEVKDHIIVKNKSDFRKIEIKGLGGTELNPGVDYISKNKELRNLNTLILTDGVCGKLNVNGLKKCMVISHNKKVDVIGNAKQIVIK